MIKQKQLFLERKRGGGSEVVESVSDSHISGLNHNIDHGDLNK